MNIDNRVNRDRRNFQLRFLREVALLGRMDTFLDYGCGPLRLGRKLIPQLLPGKYVGVDIRGEAIKDAMNHLYLSTMRSHAPLIVLFDPDKDPMISGLSLQGFDIIWAFSVLIHMTDERLDSFLKLVSHRLAAGGKAYANVNLGPKWYDTERGWDGFPVVWRPIEELKQRAEAVGLECKKLNTLKHYGSALNDAADAQVMLLFTHAD